MAPIGIFSLLYVFTPFQVWPPTSLPWGLFWGPKKETFKPPYLKITFGTNMTFPKNTAELLKAFVSLEIPDRQQLRFP